MQAINPLLALGASQVEYIWVIFVDSELGLHPLLPYGADRWLFRLRHSQSKSRTSIGS